MADKDGHHLHPGQNSECPIAENFPYDLYYLCAKFHAFFIKGTILLKYYTYLQYYLLITNLE